MKRKLLKTLALAVMVAGGWSQAWAGDFIEDATTIKVANTETSATSGDKKTLTFTANGNDAAIEFTFTGKTVTPGEIFGVVESNCSSNDTKCRFRNLTLGGTALEDKAAGNTTKITLDNGNTLVICSILSNSIGETLGNYYANNVDNTSFALTYARAYVGTTSGSSITVNRIGVYTLGEILTLYPELKTKNWQINHQYRLLNDGSNNANNSQTNNGTDNGWIETKNNASAITTLAGCKLFVKAVDPANIPDNYKYFYFRFLQPTEATTEDIFTDVKDDVTLMLSFGVSGSNPHVMAKLPTMHKKIIDFDRNMFNYTFVDGIAPSAITKVDVKGSQTTNYATFSRKLKAGFNSCAMPFKKIASASDVPVGITFYKVKQLSGDAVQFEKITAPTDNNTFTDGTNWTPVIIKAEKAGVYTFVGRDGIADLSGYKAKTVGGSDNKVFWVGSFVNEVPTGDYASTTNYGITADGTSFAQMGSGVKTTYYRAFLADNRGSSARALALSFGDEATAISSIEAAKADNGYYNLSGQRVEKPTKGLYIVNGKKVIIK